MSRTIISEACRQRASSATSRLGPGATYRPQVEPWLTAETFECASSSSRSCCSSRRPRDGRSHELREKVQVRPVTGWLARKPDSRRSVPDALSSLVSLLSLALRLAWPRMSRQTSRLSWPPSAGRSGGSTASPRPSSAAAPAARPSLPRRGGRLVIGTVQVRMSSLWT
jgi:hypothetical protein